MMLGNTNDGLRKEECQTILDKLSQRLYNFSYKKEQIRRIMIVGIQGCGIKVARWEAAKESQELRIITKLTGRISWF